jgi:predicted sulfurtransferase
MVKIIIYYKYINIDSTKDLLDWQKELCSKLNLKGRIIIAKEGINSTLAGDESDIENYKNEMLNHYLFYDLDIKESYGNYNPFPRLSIKIKNEIVNLGIDPELISASNHGEYLTPTQAHEFISKYDEDNSVILDTRNNYESRIGSFQYAIKPNINYFRELPKFIDENEHIFKDKDVLMFCTAGVRCERATSYLKSKNIARNIYHIKGGIQRYIEQYPDGYFRGKNYVFDGRIAVKVTKDVFGKCDHCFIAYDDYSNCINAECNKHILVCNNCKDYYHNTCSKECLYLVENNKVNIRKVKKINNNENLNIH